MGAGDYLVIVGESVHDVEVAALGEGEAGGGGGAGEVEEAGGEIGVEVVASVGVGGGDEVVGAGGGGDTEHFGGFGFVAGAVVETGEEMAVEVDHGGGGLSCYCRGERAGGGGGAKVRKSDKSGSGFCRNSRYEPDESPGRVRLQRRDMQRDSEAH